MLEVASRVHSTLGGEDIKTPGLVAVISGIQTLLVGKYKQKEMLVVEPHQRRVLLQGN